VALVRVEQEAGHASQELDGGGGSLGAAQRGGEDAEGGGVRGGVRRGAEEDGGGDAEEQSAARSELRAQVVRREVEKRVAAAAKRPWRARVTGGLRPC